MGGAPPAIDAWGGVYRLAPPGTAGAAGAGAERSGAIEARLARLEKLLEELVEQRARDPAPRERH
jgi:hypothetical protein